MKLEERPGKIGTTNSILLAGPVLAETPGIVLEGGSVTEVRADVLVVHAVAKAALTGQNRAWRIGLGYSSEYDLSFRILEYPRPASWGFCIGGRGRCDGRRSRKGGYNSNSYQRLITVLIQREQQTYRVNTVS